MQNVTIETRPVTTAFAIEYTGPYMEMAGIFEKIWQWVFQNNLQQQLRYGMGIYYSDPAHTPPEQCKADACVILAEPYPIPTGPVRRVEMPAGQYARYRHVGPYSRLEEAYSAFYRQWLPTSGYQCADTPPFEIYVNNPYDTAEENLITDIYLRLKTE